MKVVELIEQLKQFNPETEVCIFDVKKNGYHGNADEDDSSNGKGIEPDFKVELQTRANKPFVSLIFDNKDYENDGSSDLSERRKAEKFDEIFNAVEDIVQKDGSLEEIAEATVFVTSRY